MIVRRGTAWVLGSLAVCLAVIAAGLAFEGQRRSERLRTQLQQFVAEMQAPSDPPGVATSVRAAAGATVMSKDFRCTARVTAVSDDGVRLTVSLDAESPQAYPPLPAGQALTLTSGRDACRVRVMRIEGEVAVLAVALVPRTKTTSPVA